MKYIFVLGFCLAVISSSAQVYKFRAFQTHVTEPSDGGKRGNEISWDSTNILVVINLAKQKIKTYGQAEGDYSILESKSVRQADGYDWLIYSVVDEDGEKCTAKLLLFPRTDDMHVANLVVVYPKNEIIFRLRKDE